MAVAFQRGQQLGRNDLNLYLTNDAGHPVNAAEIYYALVDVTTGLEVVVGGSKRTPVNPSVGEYYASIVIPLDANIGSYRVRWYFRETVSGPLQSVVQEFEVVERGGSSLVMVQSDIMTDTVRRLRILLRDNDPDRNYRFRPPAHEETVGQYNKVFGFIWEDYELAEYIERGMDMVVAVPPRTPFASVEQMIQQKREWTTLLLTAAMIHALQALRINWVADEFSLAPETEVRVLLPGGREADVSLESLYRNCKEGTGAIKDAFLKGQLRVRSVTSDGHLVEAPVADVLKHHTSGKRAFQVSLEGGSRVTVTEDHSLFTYVQGVLSPIRTDALSVTTPVVHVQGSQVMAQPVVGLTLTASLPISYDLSVPGPENFVLSNGILAHNSYSIGGVSLDIDKASKYESALTFAADQFDKQIEKAKQTLKIVKGLQQPKFGPGVRSSFGPYMGRGVLSPRKFM